ncbi:FxSxx-COOH system tetratricopeptide repeat protein [Streptomyces sp. NPDC127084]|uniref:FxSxx-COOH system tetratricopeptide repeat protein n=1 Tax=Streptomyces sp. NPDC127084 TaxID=3347133 RepID=UPI003656D424
MTGPDLASGVHGTVSENEFYAPAAFQTGDGGRQHNHFYQGKPVVSWPHWIGVVPREADCFEQRDALQRLQRALGEEATLAPTQVITGPGGVGKTQLAAHYARAAWKAGSIDLLVWINASSRSSLITGYGRAGVEVAGADGRDLEGAAARFLAWAETTDRRWLVVLDDVSNTADLRGLWPPAHPGSQERALITTRRRDAALISPSRERFGLGPFTPSEAHSYFARALTAHGRAPDPDEIDVLVSKLGCLPLALAQARAFLVDMALTCSQYRERLEDNGQALCDLFPEEGSLPDDQENSVATTWRLAIERADKLTPAGVARPLLEIASVLDPNGVPLSVLTSPPALAYLAARRAETHTTAEVQPTGHDVMRAVRCLHRMSLADHGSESPTDNLRIHALVQRATRESLPSATRDTVARACADALLHAWPPTAVHGNALATMLRANAEALMGHAEEALWSNGCHELLLRTGTSLGECGMPQLANAYFARLTARAEARLGGREHPDVLFCRHLTAWWRGVAGDPSGAASATSEAVAGLATALGPEHPDVLAARNSLAYWQGAAGDPRGAAAATESLLADLHRVLGPDHQETLTARSTMTWWLGMTGEWRKAATETQELLNDLMRVLGPDHPHTLSARADHARWRGTAGAPSEARTALTELLTDLTRIFGPDHLQTLGTRGAIARWTGVAGDATSAADDFAGILADCLRTLGPDHPYTLTTRSGLARWRGVAGDAAGAVEALTVLLADRARVLGREHPDTLAVRAGLAWWHGEAGRPDIAARELAVLVTDITRVLGAEHPDTAAARRSLFYWRTPAQDRPAMDSGTGKFPTGARRPSPPRTPQRLGSPSPRSSPPSPRDPACPSLGRRQCS